MPDLRKLGLANENDGGACILGGGVTGIAIIWSLVINLETSLHVLINSP